MKILIVLMNILQKNAPNSLNGIVLNFTPCYPSTESEADKRATDYADQYINQWYIKPLFDGSYPLMINELDADCRPEILDGDMEIIAQPLDFLGVNYYTRLTYSAPTVDGEFLY
jgi:Beta-glucosidase/6-phospho-beta-glucosidase/beta-galactosidase